MIHLVAVAYVVTRSSSVIGKKVMMDFGQRPTLMFRMRTYLVVWRYIQLPGVILQVVVPHEDITADSFTSKRERSQQEYARKLFEHALSEEWTAGLCSEGPDWCWWCTTLWLKGQAWTRQQDQARSNWSHKGTYQQLSSIQIPLFTWRQSSQAVSESKSHTLENVSSLQGAVWRKGDECGFWLGIQKSFQWEF